MVARTGEGWRRTLNNGSFAIHRMGCDSERREVADVQALIGVLESEFDIRVPTHATLMRTLERLIVPQ
jgi:N-hydroxyarylamine O-acetyltransferase